MRNKNTTRLICSNHSLIASGSSFNAGLTELKESLIWTSSKSTTYNYHSQHFNDSVIELSKQHPSESFTGVTWNASDHTTAVDVTFIVKDGKEEIVYLKPHYEFLYPCIRDEEYNQLVDHFVEHARRYFERIESVRDDPSEGIVFDVLSTKDKNGFQSYCEIVWEDDVHRFTALKRYPTTVIIDYERKDNKIIERK
jgi:hypothetical protein